MVEYYQESREDNHTRQRLSITECLTTEITDIADRIYSDVFPVVEPAKQKSLSQCEAEEVLAWVQKEDAVLIQSYINEQYEKYRSAAGVLPAIILSVYTTLENPEQPESRIYMNQII